MVPDHQYALLRPDLLRSNSTAMRMSIPEPLDEPIEASELMLAFHHRLLLYHQSTRNQEDQNSLFDPNKVTDLTLRIMAPGPDIFTVVAKNCPNLRVLTVYDGVDFQPGNPVEVPYRFAKEWATGLAGLHTIEKLTYVWTLDSPRDGAIEAPGRTRLTTRCVFSPRLCLYHLNARIYRWDEDAERRTVSILVADSQSIQEITFAVFRPFIANQSDRECMARKVTWRKQSSADWTVEVQNEVEL